jgi:hypothetical protein
MKDDLGLQTTCQFYTWQSRCFLRPGWKNATQQLGGGKAHLTVITFNSRTPSSSMIPCYVGWVIREVTELEFYSSNLLFIPSENIGSLPKMCELPTVLSRAKHSCSFPPHTCSFPPHSTGTVSQTSQLQWWCQWSLSSSSYLPYSYTVTALLGPVTSIQSIFIYLYSLGSLLLCHMSHSSWNASLTPLTPVVVTGWWEAHWSFDLQ